MMCNTCLHFLNKRPVTVKSVAHPTHIILYLGGVRAQSSNCRILIETPLAGKASWENDLSRATKGFIIEQVTLNKSSLLLKIIFQNTETLQLFRKIIKT